MKLSSAVEQACCIMALLANPANKNPITNEMLADTMDVSPTYLKKITRKLVVHGIISSTQGSRGGFELARSMSHITLHDVVEAVEGGTAFFQSRGIIERVFEQQNRQAKIGLTMLERVFGDAQRSWVRTLQRITLKDFVKEVSRGR